MFFNKRKSKKIAELINKFHHNIKNTRGIIDENCKASKSAFSSYSAQLDALEQNFTRLVERYKYDEKKIAQILFDSLEYCNAIDESVIWSGIDDYFEYDKLVKPLWLKQEEIDLRFKNLLGEQYIDPLKLIRH